MRKKACSGGCCSSPRDTASVSGTSHGAASGACTCTDPGPLLVLVVPVLVAAVDAAVVADAMREQASTHPSIGGCSRPCSLPSSSLSQ